MSEHKFTPIEELSYEQALQELEELVNTLEIGEKDLHTTLLFFERGQSLASYCISLLDQILCAKLWWLLYRKSEQPE